MMQILTTTSVGANGATYDYFSLNGRRAVRRARKAGRPVYMASKFPRGRKHPVRTRNAFAKRYATVLRALYATRKDPLS